MKNLFPSRNFFGSGWLRDVIAGHFAYENDKIKISVRHNLFAYKSIVQLEVRCVLHFFANFAEYFLNGFKVKEAELPGSCGVTQPNRMHPKNKGGQIV
jgi:hypothetical protein